MTFNDSKPIYLQIAELISDKISSQQWAEGERIPSVRELASDVEVNPNTVMRAYEALAQSGVICNKRGVGFFVVEGARTVLNGERRTELFDVELRAIAMRMKELGVTMNEVVSALERHINS